MADTEVERLIVRLMGDSVSYSTMMEEAQQQADALDANLQKLQDFNFDSSSVDTTDFGVATDQAADLSQEVDALNKQLEEQIRTFGMTATEAKMYELQLQGVSEAELEYTRSLSDQIDQLKDHNRLMAEGHQLTEAYADPLSKIADERDRANEMLQAGAIDADTYSARLEDLNDQEQSLESGGRSMAASHRAVGHGLSMLGKAVGVVDGQLGSYISITGQSIRYTAMAEKSYFGLSRSLDALRNSYLVATAASYGFTLPVLAIGAAAGLAAYGIYRLVQATDPMAEAMKKYEETLKSVQESQEKNPLGNMRNWSDDKLPEDRASLAKVLVDKYRKDVEDAESAKQKLDSDLTTARMKKAQLESEVDPSFKGDKSHATAELDRATLAIYRSEEKVKAAEEAISKQRTYLKESTMRYNDALWDQIRATGEVSELGRQYAGSLDNESAALERAASLTAKLREENNNLTLSLVASRIMPGHEEEGRFKNAHALDNFIDPAQVQKYESGLAKAKELDSKRLTEAYTKEMEVLKDKAAVAGLVADEELQETTRLSALARGYNETAAARLADMTVKISAAKYYANTQQSMLEEAVLIGLEGEARVRQVSIIQSQKNGLDELQQSELAENAVANYRHNQIIAFNKELDANLIQQRNLTAEIRSSADPMNEQLQMTTAVDNAMRSWNESHKDATQWQRKAQENDLRRIESLKLLNKHFQEGSALRDRYMLPEDKMVQGQKHLNDLLNEGALGKGEEAIRVYNKALMDLWLTANKDYTVDLHLQGAEAMLGGTNKLGIALQNYRRELIDPLKQFDRMPKQAAGNQGQAGAAAANNNQAVMQKHLGDLVELARKYWTGSAIILQEG